MKNRYLLIFFIVILLFLLSCSPKTQETPQAVKNLEKFKFITIEHPNKPAPAFTLTDDKGNTFTSSDLKGKVYILQGFAPGCSSCAREIATLNKVYYKFKGKGLEIISLDIASETIDGAISTKKQFNGGDWRWAVDLDNVAIKFEMRTLESTYIIDKTGIIMYKDESLSDSETLSQEIEKLI
ncbi:redoxin domain-containing protein [Candidatus Woesearchaeota archaeon]|nr:redoxin domain-containing protein [Candidatus Woesearchaeota archaeon]